MLFRSDVEPSGTVTISVSADSQCTLSGASLPLTFDGTNWSTAQTVVVTAVDDAVAEGPHSCAITTGAASGGGYVSVAVAEVTANVTDNDAVGVIATASDSDAEEVTPATAGTVASFLVRLGSQPTGPVTVTLTNDAQCTVTSSLSFDDTNWNTDQTVTEIGRAHV